jgi:serine/threonine-protein kinase RsbW
MAESRRPAAQGDRSEFVHRSRQAHPRQLAPLRGEVRRWLASLALSEDAEDGLVLAVSEAASNSVEHAYTPPTDDDTVELTFWTESRAVCLEVVDHGRWQTPSDDPGGRGRGIDMMQRLVAFVLIHHDGRGTRVHFRHPLPAVRSRRASSSRTDPSHAAGTASDDLSGAPSRR